MLHVLVLLKKLIEQNPLKQKHTENGGQTLAKI